ncbi:HYPOTHETICAL PROTEIN MCJ_000830 [Mesomycoplasma conjunctivae]|uniref:Uncharacterized protein n=1 Tax=Mesomycoplasma conjunctivae (strain ATCC 25834 / NCTC 10147 / HRC/581) TaxID=572263 RepID=C5J5N5_MESCH|nr:HYPOTHETICAL PROTEIN MCJ_000830 [Mesomycoplasma conjunctivae]
MKKNLKLLGLFTRSQKWKENIKIIKKTEKLLGIKS